LPLLSHLVKTPFLAWTPRISMIAPRVSMQVALGVNREYL
jgi:hypothetical protein